MSDTPDGWNRQYERNEIRHRVYEKYGVEISTRVGVEISVRHHLVTCLSCGRLWGIRREGYGEFWWQCPEGCNRAK
jgi:hypothetical protein